MGLDIYLRANNQQTLRAVQPDYPDFKEYSRLYGLSRTFCNFLCKRKACGSPAELDQLGELAGVDIQPLYEMETYPTEELVQWDLEDAQSEEARQAVLQEAKEIKERLRGNIDRVQATVDGLLSQLASYDNLPARVDAGIQDTLHNAVYFANFLQEAPAGPVAYHNFGQDLRTIQRFLTFARTHNSHTVFFEFG